MTGLRLRGDVRAPSLWNLTATEETLQSCLCSAEALSYLRKQMSCLRKMAPGFIREGSEVFRTLAQEA